MKAVISLTHSDRTNFRNMGRNLGTFAVVNAVWFIGVVVGQTTLIPAVTNSTTDENVTMTTPMTTPIPLTTTPAPCSAFNISTCEVCSPGSYYDNETLQCSCCPQSGLCLPEACLPCERGFYQPLSGQLHCQPCRQGSYSNVTGSSVCQSCPAGSYTNSTGSETCKNCSPGFYSSGPNATSCDPCPQGTFCNSSRCPLCHLCPIGTESLQSASKDCTPCRPGMHKAARQTMCQICTSGFYQLRWGQEACNVCPENHYCPSPDVSPIQCPNDAFCPEGSIAPGYCMETFFRKAGESCELAPVTIALLVIAGGMVLLLMVLLVLRRRRETDGELSLSRAPLLHKDRHPSRYYTMPGDTEPVYAGW
ncbi:hypothetical protein COCON_G00104970 [Conger conger]|uniref:Tyrosine-protein kinase ephrin type A/B receptor-like domain-containing protein n=1 Tax=Conger conger TaxID=82655 RepID=A0A9Q1DIV2_CONCO|nr:laminin subunit gamma-1 [Conger conger]KAJ8271638.1 hypothetical protein COCON_G00104970 [Conger conger]